MSVRLIGTDDADPRLPDVVIAATQGTTSDDLAPGDTLDAAIAYTDAAVAEISAGGVADDAVTNAKLADVATNRIKGRVTATTGDPEDLTPAQARTVIASDSGGGTANFLRADATWAAPAGGSLTDGDKGDVVVSGTGATWLFDTGVVTAAAKTVLDDTTTAAMLTTLGAQPVDTDLTAIAGLSTSGVIVRTGSGTVATRLIAGTANRVTVTNGDATSANPVIDIGSDVALITRTVNTYSGTSVTAVIGDAGAYVRCTGTNPTYTLPPNSSVAFAVGTQIDGVGTATAMTLVAGGGVTVNKARTLVTVGADSGWTAIKVATDEWDCHGDFV